MLSPPSNLSQFVSVIAVYFANYFHLTFDVIEYSCTGRIPINSIIFKELLGQCSYKMIYRINQQCIEYLNLIHMQSYKKSFTFLHKTRLIIQPCLWQVIILIITNDRWLDMFNNMKWSIWIEGAVASISFPSFAFTTQWKIWLFLHSTNLYVCLYIEGNNFSFLYSFTFPRNKGLTRHATDDNMSNRVFY